MLLNKRSSDDKKLKNILAGILSDFTDKMAEFNDK